MNIKKLSANGGAALIEFVRCRIILSARIPLPPIVGALTLLLLSSTLLTNPVLGQIFPNNQVDPTATPTPPSTLQQQQAIQPKLHLVKITSPAKGQHVPAPSSKIDFFLLQCES